MLKNNKSRFDLEWNRLFEWQNWLGIDCHLHHCVESFLLRLRSACRYLIFFDDGYAQYSESKYIRQVHEQSEYSVSQCGTVCYSVVKCGRMFQSVSDEGRV